MNKPAAEYTFTHIAKETDKAWLIEIDSVQRWIPKSAGKIEGNKITLAHWFNAKMDVSGAVFSEDKKHRYVLWRHWNPKGKFALCVGLNPSKATQDKNDPTIRFLIEILSKLGYGGLYMTNLFTIISPDPAILLSPEAHRDEKTDIGCIFGYSLACQDVIFCWGTFEEAKQRQQRIIDFYKDALCFGVNKDGSPWHPRYVHYAFQKGETPSLFKFSEHEYARNKYSNKSRKNKIEYNQKQYPLNI
jgi:hypothetical protein